MYNCTWEPYPHIPSTVRSQFINPVISNERLNHAGFTFEKAIQNRLSSRINRCVIDFDADISRCCFGLKSVCIVEESDLKKLHLSVGWYYRINKKGKGCKLSFPIRLVSRVYMRKKYVVSSEKLVIESHIPMEKLIIISATEVMNV